MLQRAHSRLHTLRSSFCQPKTIFHHQTARQFSLLPLYALTTDLLSIAHNTGLPWAVAIPTTTFIIKFCTMKWTHISIQKLNRKEHMVQPFRIGRTITANQMSGVEASRRQEWKIWLKFWEDNAKVKYGIKRYAKVGPVLTQVGIWLLLTDSFRYMLGARRGILSLLYPESLMPFPEYFIDPTLVSEGLLWCSTFAAVDPWYTLPISLGAITYYSTKKAQSPILKAIQLERPRLAKIASWSPALAFGGITFIASQVPAGLVLYWTSSAAAGLWINTWLNKKYPARTMPQPCTTGFDSNRLAPNWILDPSAAPANLTKRSRS